MKKNPVNIPHIVRHADGIRRGGRGVADVLGFTLYELMLRADEAAFQVCRLVYPDARHWLALYDHDSNGGDGYMIARLATAVGIEITLLAQENGRLLSEEAALVCEAQLSAGGKIHASDIVWPELVGLIADTLLGIGLQRAPRKSVGRSIGHVNSHPTPVTVVDISSGLLAETGAIPGAVINADHTTTFIALKLGLLTRKVRGVTGQLHFDSLGLDS